MGIEAFKREALRFLGNKTSGVLMVAGKWGVGKTYAWNSLLREARDGGQIQLKKYAYVSLFGLSSLDDVKQAIVENTVDKENIGKNPDLSSLQKAVETVTANWKKGFSFISSFGPMTEYAAAVSKVGFFFVRDQIICIDDLERKSEALSIRDILGLVSFLKEQRGCKVVVLLNDEKLGDAEEEFRRQLEKVADVAVKFAPTAEQAADIGIDNTTPFAQQFRRDCIALGIVNIRTIKKLEAYANRLEEELSSFDPRVREQAVHSLVLFGYAHLEPDLAPTIGFIKSYNRYEGMLGDRQEPLPHPEWRALLAEFGWSHVDDLDAVVAKGVQDGHFDPALLKEESQKLQRQFEHADADNSFSAAWDLYHGSFDNNGHEVTEALAAAVRSVPGAISPMNLSSTIRVLKELGWPGDVNELIEHYIQSREGEDERFWNLRHSAFGDEVTDPDVRSAFDRKLASFRDERDPEEVLERLGLQQGWNPEDIQRLASLTADDFYRIFKGLRGSDGQRAVRAALMFRNSQGEAEMTITRNAKSALKRIGLESPINARRVRREGMLTAEDMAEADPPAA